MEFLNLFQLLPLLLLFCEETPNYLFIMSAVL